MELKPCPFCGSENVNLMPREHWVVGKGVKFEEPVAFVECFSCFAVAGFFRIKKLGEKKAKEKAVEAWNKRADNHGRWHSRFYYRESTKAYDCEMHVCSECGSEWSYDAETGSSDFNYCPNCGAKMGGE